MMMMTLILNGNNEPLAEASCSRPAGESSAGAVLRTSGPDRIPGYYFGSKGRRIVLRHADGSAEHARILGTRWDPRGRLWFVRALAD
jgi:hypothetical protein